MNLNTARVFVRDIASAKGFYADALGLGIKADGCSHGFCVFDAGSSTLVIEAVPADAPQDPSGNELQICEQPPAAR